MVKQIFYFGAFAGQRGGFYHGFQGIKISFRVAATFQTQRIKYLSAFWNRFALHFRTYFVHR
jgi:hypothetical protein